MRIRFILLCVGTTMIIIIALFTTVDYADTMYSVMCRYNDDNHYCFLYNVRLCRYDVFCNV